MNTKALRQKILDLAIHGKLVPQDPNDESASVLLERIRDEKERLIKEGKIKRPKKSKTTSDKPHYENVPFEIPDGWCWTTIEDVCSKFSTGPFGSMVHKTDYVANDGVPMVNPANIVNSNVSNKYLVLVSVDKAKDLRKYRLEEGDVVIARRGDLSKCAVINKKQQGFLCGTGSFSLHLIYILPEYFQLVYLSPYVQSILNTECVGATMNNLNQGVLGAVLFPLPPLNEQYKILLELEKHFSFIDLLESKSSNLYETIKQAKSKILDLAIHGKLVPQNPMDEPASELLKRINPKAEITSDNGHYQKLPEGWAVCTLKNVCKVITGSTPSKSNPIYYGGNIPFYKPADLDFGRYVKNASEYLSEEGMCVSRVVPAGSTAVCCIGTIGKVGYLVNAGTTNQQINCAIPSKAVYDVFLFYLCSSSWFYNNLIKKSSAVTISIVNKSKMENIEIPLPPLEEQHRIVAKIEEIFTQLDAIEASL